MRNREPFFIKTFLYPKLLNLSLTFFHTKICGDAFCINKTYYKGTLYE